MQERRQAAGPVAELGVGQAAVAATRCTRGRGWRRPPPRRPAQVELFAAHRPPRSRSTTLGGRSTVDGTLAATAYVIARRAAGQAATTCWPRSLLVVLDDRGRSGGGLVGVLAGVAPGPALAQQVPALVEGDLDGAELLRLLGGETLSDVRLLEAVLLLGELVDLG